MGGSRGLNTADQCRPCLHKSGRRHRHLRSREDATAAKAGDDAHGAWADRAGPGPQAPGPQAQGVPGTLP